MSESAIIKIDSKPIRNISRRYVEAGKRMSIKKMLKSLFWREKFTFYLRSPKRWPGISLAAAYGTAELSRPCAGVQLIPFTSASA